MLYSALSAASSSISICLSVIGRLFGTLAAGPSYAFLVVDRRELRNSLIVEAASLVIFLFAAVRGGCVSNIGIGPSSAPYYC